MGVLDDAIRQHLELKRQHGADESEVQRKANEALGPVRREPAPAQAPASDVEAVEPTPGATEPDDLAPDELEPDELAPDELAPEQPLSVREPPPAAETAPAIGAEPAADPPHDEPSATEPPGGETPTRGFDALEDDGRLSEPPPPAAAPDGDDDVLEETPDFLQETPEHDRLWFEQKPPRDFDFDD